MSAGYGALPPLGKLMVVVSVIDLPPTCTLTVNVLPEYVAVTSLALGGSRRRVAATR
jgi:hypothetical protein